MSYHIQSDKHWRISKSGYSIKTGFEDNSRIVASYHAPHTPFDGPRFEQWLEDARHACDLHNASIDGAARADARIAELEAEVSGLRVDAERWRKLRGMHWSKEDDFTVTRGRSVKLGFLAYSGEQLDAAIDAARANGGGE